MTTITVNREITGPAGCFVAFGPIDGDMYATWSREEGAEMGRFVQADDAIDLAHELANS